jgi:orotate phosphoribosyltransferase-like protein
MNTLTQTPAAMRSANTFAKGEIVENFFTVNGRESVIVCKVIETLADGHVRIADLRDCVFGVTSHALIESNKTWGAPVENLRVHDTDCKYCHKDGLVAMG